MLKYIASSDSTPGTILLTFRDWLIGISCTLFGCMTLDDADGNRAGTIIGYYRPRTKDGIGIHIWPFALWIQWPMSTHQCETCGCDVRNDEECGCLTAHDDEGCFYEERLDDDYEDEEDETYY